MKADTCGINLHMICTNICENDDQNTSHLFHPKIRSSYLIEKQTYQNSMEKETFSPYVIHDEHRIK